MSVTTLEPWVDKAGIAEFFACSVSQIEKWTRAGMPSRIIAGRRKYKASLCDPWVELYDQSSKDVA